MTTKKKSYSIGAGEFLAEQSKNLTVTRKPTADLKMTSMRLTLGTDAKVQAISEITNLSRNKVLQYLLESAIETYESDIMEYDVIEEYHALVTSRLEANEK